MATTFSQVFDCELPFGMYTSRTTVSTPQSPVHQLPQDLAKPHTRFQGHTAAEINAVNVASGNQSLDPGEFPQDDLDNPADFNLWHFSRDSLGDSPGP